MTFLEIVREIVLPSVGALAGLGGLIMFISSRGQRQAATRKTEAEADQIVRLTVGNLHQKTTDAAAQALAAQRVNPKEMIPMRLSKDHPFMIK
jgi:uncharacterized membrane protein YgaE (UPF0421/DUF939 family)